MMDMNPEKFARFLSDNENVKQRNPRSKNYSKHGKNFTSFDCVLPIKWIGGRWAILPILPYLTF